MPAEIAWDLGDLQATAIGAGEIIEALAAAVAGEMAPFEKLLDAVTHPFDDTAANRPYRDGPPSGCGPYKTFCGT